MTIPGGTSTYTHNPVRYAVKINTAINTSSNLGFNREREGDGTSPFSSSFLNFSLRDNLSTMGSQSQDKSKMEYSAGVKLFGILKKLKDKSAL